ncbi:MAG: hypothetical protein KKG99_02205 [Bacteroidetes bacterium]|nr:hypothetical protein [Bacteroidota bacterium]
MKKYYLAYVICLALLGGTLSAQINSEKLESVLSKAEELFKKRNLVNALS